MARKAQGRGAAAGFGFLVLFAGLIAGVVLWILADREPNRAAESFARAAPGCATTISFADPGEFYIYEELSGVLADVDGCLPTTVPGVAFGFDIAAPSDDMFVTVADNSLSYDLDAGQGQSVARLQVVEPGDYVISVRGSDPAVVAAVGGDPQERVALLRRGAIASAAVGLVLGALLLALSGRRSRRAAIFESPLDPGWGVTERERAARANPAEWTFESSASAQVPVNPHDPEERRVAEVDHEPPPIDPLLPGASSG